MPQIVKVLLPLPLAGAYDYLLPDGMSVEAGQMALVPLGSRQAVGVAWGLADRSEAPPDKLKPVIGLCGADFAVMPPATMGFVDWVARYTLTPPGAVLKMVLGSLKLSQRKKGDKFNGARAYPDHCFPALNEEQGKASELLVGKVENGGYSATLLDGVTGSGKTEVFCEAVAACLRQGRQALILLPEIAMTAALLDRLAARFGAKLTEWHSELTERQRRLNWHAIARGEANLVLGARSALFLPYPDLGLIVVDEEHEAAYKQEEGVIYHGRDMAVARAHIGGIPIVLSSATPSLETLYNVRQGKYGSARMINRFGVARMPEIKLIDLRACEMGSQRFLSPPLLKALTETLEKKQQAMLFLNRRGYAPLTLCRACGHRLQCPNCTSWLIEHKAIGKLRCHHCDYVTKIPQACPSCKAEGKFAACGPGIERIAEELRAVLPAARFSIMASDTLSGPQAAQELVRQMAEHELDLLIGTQIMAKGYHFPALTLVGVIDADLGLGGGDPRATERTFQLLQQMAGRSGRAEEAGRVLLQTTAPEHPVMQALVKGDRDAFMQAELQERAAWRLPPVCKLASLTVSGAHAPEVIALANELAAKAPQLADVSILGPAPAPFAMLRGRYRHRLMIQAPRSVNLPNLVRDWVAQVKVPHALRLHVDIDPYGFL
ncbi:MAG: primosomal protein N' [Bdellovibrionales bacterium]